MSITITGVVTNGVIVPGSPLPEGTRVEIHVLTGDVPNPVLTFHGHLDPNDPAEIEFMEELGRLKWEDLARTLREDEECPNSSSIPTT
jgi:hypothetical protein